jgi:hypothetical protein
VRLKNYAPVRGFSGDASALAQQLGLLQDRVVQKFGADQKDIFGQWTNVEARADYVARYWDIVLANPSSGAFSVALPSPIPGGPWITVTNMSASSNVITVRGATSTIRVNGAATYAVSGPYAAAVFVPTSTTEWTVLSDNLPRGSQAERFLIWDQDTSSWSAGSTAPRTLDTTYDPVALYQFNRGAPNGVNDQSGNGFNLAPEAGIARYTWMHPGMQGYLFDGSNGLIYNTAEASLARTGEMSAIYICTIQQFPGSEQVLLTHEAAGETEATNVLYSHRFRNAIGDQFILTYQHEHSAGVDVAFNLGSAWAFPNVITMFGFSRVDNGNGTVTITHYNQGFHWATSTATAVTKPSGGSSGRLRIGRGAGGLQFTGLMMAAAIYPTALTAEQHRERFNYCLGRAFGHQ